MIAFLAGVLTILAIGIGIILTGIVSIFLIEVLSARLHRGATGRAAVPDFRMAIIVPAHDEEAIIAETIRGYRLELSARDRLIVVADNCTDATFELAAAAGADVVRRDDADKRGKGYALDFAIRHMESDPPDAVVIMDSDCRVAAGTLRALATQALCSGRPVQAFYDMELPEAGRTPGMVIATFAHRVKDLLRPLGLKVLGLPCQANGTGIAFPWRVIASAHLGTSEIVEDLVLGLELARDGTPPQFHPEIRVASAFPATAQGQNSQRTRWETGHINVIARQLPRLAVAAIRQRNFNLLALVLDSAVPPLAFVALLLMGYGVFSALLFLAIGTVTPLYLFLACSAAFTLAVFDAWLQVGRDILALSDLIKIPFYIFRKAALYGRILRGRRVGWIRTSRDR